MSAEIIELKLEPSIGTNTMSKTSSKKKQKKPKNLAPSTENEVMQWDKTIESKTVSTDERGFIRLDAFSGWINTGKVKYYSMDINEDRTVTVKFYDKNKKLVKPL